MIETSVWHPRTLVKVAQWHYEDDLTQADIAERLGVSRSTVSRMLARSREEGYVRITIDALGQEGLELEHRLEQRFGLDEALVASTDDTGVSLYQTAADALGQRLKENLRVGVSWGQSVAGVVNHIARQRTTSVTVVALAGGMADENQNLLSNTIALTLANRWGAKAITMPAPAITSSVAACATLMQEPLVQDTLANARQVDVALVGIGVVQPQAHASTMALMQYVDATTADQLMRAGAVGDLCSRFFDRQGHPVWSELDDRTVGIGFDDLKRIPVVIGVAFGTHKVGAIRAALSGHLINVLATDAATAELLLQETRRKRVPS